MVVYVFLFFGESFSMYLYYYGWEALKGTSRRAGTVLSTAILTLLVLYPDGVETVLGATTLDREVWLYPGTAVNPAHQQFAGYTWSGNYTTSATFNGSPVTIAWTISDAYSLERFSGIGSPRPSASLTRSNSTRLSSLRRMYSSTGIR